LFGAALHELRSAYDYIVIDTAAVLEGADADIAGECADGVILVTRTQTSRRSALARAVKQLGPARIFGSVLFDT
jgi:Mrp family chromosome partitioning ATPase